jgi:protein involved in polysaccharide export with SLBB domain
MNLIRHITTLFVSLLLLAIVASCSIKSQAVSDAPEPTDLQIPVVTDQTESSTLPVFKHTVQTPYLVRFGDVLQVNFNYAPEFDKHVTVRPDGKITIPWMGDLEAVGRTTDDIASSIEAVYSDMILNPQLIVSVTTIAPLRFYVFGEVLRPGYFDVPDRVSLMEAIAMAGGMTERAEWKSILLFHPSPGDTGTVEQINLELAVEGDMGYPIHMVESFDVVYIPPTFISNVHKFIRDYFVNLVPPVDTFIRDRYYWRGGRE